MLRSTIQRIPRISTFAARFSVMNTSVSATPGVMEQSIRQKLTADLQPSELIITNDSWQHRHHVAMRAQGGGSGETHFTIQIVSNAFKGKSSLQRHRMVHALLSEEFSSMGLHALSLKTKTNEEALKEDPSSS